jgi:hypothetical protein
MTTKGYKNIAWTLFGLGIAGSIYSITTRPKDMSPEGKKAYNNAVMSLTALAFGGGALVGLLLPESSLIKA